MIFVPPFGGYNKKIFRLASLAVICTPHLCKRCAAPECKHRYSRDVYVSASAFVRFVSKAPCSMSYTMQLDAHLASFQFSFARESFEMSCKSYCQIRQLSHLSVVLTRRATAGDVSRATQVGRRTAAALGWT